MKLAIDALEFTKQFYGGRIPESQKQVAAVGIIKWVAVIKNDLSKEFPSAASDSLDQGVLSVLAQMRVLGATHPEQYGHTENGKRVPLAISAFQAGVDKLCQLREQAVEQKEAQLFNQRVADQGNIRAQIMAIFEGYLSKFADSELPALDAWKALVTNDLNEIDLGGYGYFVVNWRIPQDYHIFDHEDVIATCNENPRLMNRKGPTRGTRVSVRL